MNWFKKVILSQTYWGQGVPTNFDTTDTGIDSFPGSSEGWAGSGRSPMSNLDIPMSERVRPYDDSQGLFNEDQGDKPNGRRKIKVVNLVVCPDCNGKKNIDVNVEFSSQYGRKCPRCNGTGYIRKRKYIYVHKTNPRYTGRIKQEPRYNPSGDYRKGNPGSWPHNRDVDCFHFDGEPIDNISDYVQGRPH